MPGEGVSSKSDFLVFASQADSGIWDILTSGVVEFVLVTGGVGHVALRYPGATQNPALRTLRFKVDGFALCTQRVNLALVNLVLARDNVEEAFQKRKSDFLVFASKALSFSQKENRESIVNL